MLANGTGRSSKTFVKYPDFRIVLVTMRARTRVRQHRTNARIAVIALPGHIRLHLPHTTMELPAGELLALNRNLPHDVEAIQQSTFLLIISWPASSPNRGLRDPKDHVVEQDDARQIREKMLDKTIADSFPASDPPSTDPAPLADSFAA
jgi:quercetin dioxygenase-like cupin family protein